MNTPTQLERISVVGLVAIIVAHRRLLAGCSTAFVAALLAQGYLSSRTYTSRVVVVPEVSAAASGGLGNIASRFGVSLPAGGFDRSLQFFAALAKSQAVARRVVDTPLEFGGTTRSLIDHWSVRGATEGERRERGAKRLARGLRVGSDIESGSLTISVSADGPELARATVDRILFLMDSLNIVSRQAQASAERRFLAERLAASKSELESSERLLATFVARNRSYQGDANLQLEFDRLQRDVTGKQTVWIGLAQDYERARLAEVRSTPTITPVEPPTLPALGDRRHMFLRVLFGTVLGVLAPLVWIIGHHWWRLALEDDQGGREALARARSAR